MLLTEVDMISVDAHCDTITRIMDEKSNLYKNECHIDLERLNKLGNRVQFFAAFIDPLYCPANALKRAVQIIDRLYLEIDRNSEYIRLCKNFKDITETLNQKKVSAILSIEEGEALEGDLSALRAFYKLGVRSICLTWNYRNSIADGVKDGASGGGLTPFGRDVVREMNSLGMLIDLSHISEKGFWDVIDLTKAPIIVSHSNAKKLCNHSRNLSDEQILAVKRNKGVIGINLYPDFLNESRKATIKDVLAHIEHICSLTGSEHIGMGADFDGIECTPEDIKGVQDMEKIFNELGRMNYTEGALEKLAGGNFMRVIKEVLI
jgi:membrane dipeptidase